jgi:hypothetical protein
VQRNRVCVKLDHKTGEGEIIVGSDFYEEDEHEQMRLWNWAVTHAHGAGFQMLEAEDPSCDPRDSMHIDERGNEHHYLVTLVREPATAGLDEDIC